MNESQTCSIGRTTQREEVLKRALIARLNRIEGQIRGVRGMIERDAYCDEVLHQIAAASSAMDGVSKLVLENHIKGCLVERIRSGDDAIVDELITTIGKIL